MKGLLPGVQNFRNDNLALAGIHHRRKQTCQEGYIDQHDAPRVKACRGIRRCPKGGMTTMWTFLGVTPGFNYASDYRDVDGIVFPTKRRVYAHEVERQPVNEPLLVKIDMAEITLAYASPAAVSPMS